MTYTPLVAAMRRDFVRSGELEENRQKLNSLIQTGKGTPHNIRFNVLLGLSGYNRDSPEVLSIYKNSLADQVRLPLFQMLDASDHPDRETLGYVQAKAESTINHLITIHQQIHKTPIKFTHHGKDVGYRGNNGDGRFNSTPNDYPRSSVTTENSSVNNFGTFENHSTSRTPNRRGMARGRFPETRSCFTCGKIGHIARYCSVQPFTGRGTFGTNPQQGDKPDLSHSIPPTKSDF
jgi:hypothetical protein